MLRQPWRFTAVQGPIPVFDLRRRCPKCQCRWVRTRWVRVPKDITTPDDTQLVREYLARICWRCRYWWPERPSIDDGLEGSAW
ncbi:hypothetical protein ACQPZU_12210 [Saccharomonospora azurea]|uniref:hypothetical protein n=1 Tax=Saccharomonospora azurea TaxID=40988 RepID=UPI00024003AA|nr:hypothetical protein [Saccharomonospora azurea]EHK87630.1 hypothetical protein SZMC14600_09923 [Saccharomonospora azurea SZMC 14600]